MASSKGSTTSTVAPTYDSACCAVRAACPSSSEPMPGVSAARANCASRMETSINNQLTEIRQMIDEPDLTADQEARFLKQQADFFRTTRYSKAESSGTPQI